MCKWDKKCVCGIVSKYNDTYHRTTKMNPVDVCPSMYVEFNKEIIIKVLNWQSCKNVEI